jgi:DNA-binding MarR family transcriptional regulator
MSADGPVAVVIMQVVRTTPGCRILDIAEALFITVGGASKVADKVQAGGWCRRLPNPSDGRSSLIELTESGESLLEAANVTFENALEVYLGAAAPTGELIKLSNMLDRLRRHLITADLVNTQRGR